MAVTPSPITHPAAPPLGDTALRILAATATCVAAQGLRATSIDDIAEVAGCARATVYRIFPSGRAGLLAAAAELQIASVLSAAGTAADASDDLADAVASAVHAASSTLAGHAALQRLLAEEPGAVLPFISFDRLGPLLARAAAWGREHFERFLDPEQAEIVGEWAARVVLVHLRAPGSLTDPTDAAAARRLVERYLLPGLVLPSPRTPVEPGARHVVHRGHHRPPARQRSRRDPGHHQHRRRRHDPRGAGQRRHHLHVGLHQGRPPGPRAALREGQDLPVERRDRPATWSIDVDQEAVVAANAVANNRGQTRLQRYLPGEVGRRGVDRVRRAVPELDVEPVHARGAGRAAVHRQDRRDRAVDRRQVLRRHPGDGRGPPRRGLRQVPQREALRRLPGERPPADAARRHRARQPLGHDLPGHADHGRGPRPGRLRLHAPDDHRAAAQAAAPLRDERRGPPRRLRRALAEGVLRRAEPDASSGSGRSSPSRRRCACATASCSRRCGSGWACR